MHAPTVTPMRRWGCAELNLALKSYHERISRKLGVLLLPVYKSSSKIIPGVITISLDKIPKVGGQFYFVETVLFKIIEREI